MFDELLNPSPSAVNHTPEAIAPIVEVIPPGYVDSTGSPSSTTVEHDAPSTSNSPTPTKTQSLVIPQDGGDDNLDMEVAHIGNDPLFGVPIPEVTSVQSTTPASPQAILQTNHPMPHHNSKWTKDHPLNNIIGKLSRPVSTRLQLHEQSLFCYYDAFLTSVEPKTFKEALTQSCRIEAMQEELNEFERLEIWELVPRPDQVMTELLAEQAFWSQNSGNSEESNLSSSTTIVEVPKELPKVYMVNSSLKKLNFHLASFDMVVKGITTTIAIIEGAWGFKHTKDCFRDEIILFVKALKELLNSFDQFLIDELTKVQNVFNQMDQAVEQHCVEKNKFQDKMKDILKENERLLKQAISTDIVNIVVNANVNYACKTANECERCVTIETKL
nr:integrase, catalytic region, zinc finger, CCHC-type, peptidase aspartic, catalytic [Tanacetum cinerariifolium]